MIVHRPTKSLVIYTVTDHPSDYPSHFVARGQAVLPGQLVPVGKPILGETLEEVRAKLPPGLFRLPRGPLDDPVIVECWL